MEGWSERLARAAREHGDTLRALALRIVGDRTRAGEICMRAVRRAWERPESAARADALAGWLAGVVVQESLREMRQGGGRAGGRGGGSRSSRDEAMRILGTLPERDRTTAFLRWILRLDRRGTAHLLGCGEEEVTDALFRGAERLRRARPRRHHEL